VLEHFPFKMPIYLEVCTNANSQYNLMTVNALLLIQKVCCGLLDLCFVSLFLNLVMIKHFFMMCII